MNKTTDRPRLLELKSLKFFPISQDLSVDLQNRSVLGRVVCGPACIAMILNYFGKYPTNKKIQNIEWLINIINLLHKNGSPSVKQKFILDGEPRWITVGTVEEIHFAKNQREFESDSKYQPAFSLIRGYDHRISQYLFSQFGLKAGFFENVQISDIKNRLKRGEILILSVAPRRQLLTKTELIARQASHLIVVSDYDADLDRFYIIDPDYDLKIGLLAKISNYKGTWVEGIK